MSPLYANRFAGHLRTFDPRTPLTAAGACIWPTVPAHRYLLKSEDATGVLLGLNTQGILIERTTVGIGHDTSQWSMIAGPPPILWALVFKETLPDRLSYRWTVAISASFCGILLKNWTLSRRKCNVDFHIGNMPCVSTSDETGPTFTAYQVEYASSEPPPPV